MAGTVGTAAQTDGPSYDETVAWLRNKMEAMEPVSEIIISTPNGTGYKHTYIAGVTFSGFTIRYVEINMTAGEFAEEVYEMERGKTHGNVREFEFDIRDIVMPTAPELSTSYDGNRLSLSRDYFTVNLPCKNEEKCVKYRYPPYVWHCDGPCTINLDEVKWELPSVLDGASFGTNSRTTASSIINAFLRLQELAPAKQKDLF